MKKYTILVFIILTFTISQSFGQEITEDIKNEQEKVLKEKPKNFAANYIVGAYYYNEAVNPHKETTEMKLPEYLSEGGPYETKKAALLKKALPYFENAYVINKTNPNLKTALSNIYKHLGMVEMFRVSDEEIAKQVQAKLDNLTFKNIY